MAKKYFITGLLVLVPLFITLWVLSTLIRTLDQSLLLLPAAWQPSAVFGYNVPGLGALLTLLIVFFTGIVATNIFGQQLISWWEKFLNRVPVVKSIYSSVKQVSDTLFSGSNEAFSKVLLVRYPHPQAWSLAFQSSAVAASVSAKSKEPLVSVFIPTAPSPVNGFFFFVPKADVIELDMTVDEALKYMVSMGTVVPQAHLANTQ